jgi:hypothetical protein
MSICKLHVCQAIAEVVKHAHIDNHTMIDLFRHDRCYPAITTSKCFCKMSMMAHPWTQIGRHHVDKLVASMRDHATKRF